MKRLALVLILAVSIGLLAGCGADNTALSKMPTWTELNEFQQSHTPEEYKQKISEVNGIINDTSYEDICSEIRSTFEAWAKTETMIAIDNVSIEFSQDNLLMNELKCEKLFGNIFVETSIHYDGEKTKLPDPVFTDKLVEAVRSAIPTTPYGLRVHTVNLTCFDAEQIATFKSAIPISATDMSMKPKADPSEFAAQTIAYDFVKAINTSEYTNEIFNQDRKIPASIADKIPNGEIPVPGQIALRKFGIVPDTSELYIEIPIYANPIYTDNAAQDEEAFLVSLKGRASELNSLLTADKTSAQFLSDNKAKTITVSFIPTNGKQSEYTYKYDVK